MQVHAGKALKGSLRKNRRINDDLSVSVMPSIDIKEKNLSNPIGYPQHIETPYTYIDIHIHECSLLHQIPHLYPYHLFTVNYTNNENIKRRHICLYRNCLINANTNVLEINHREGFWSPPTVSQHTFHISLRSSGILWSLVLTKCSIRTYRFQGPPYIWPPSPCLYSSSQSTFNQYF